MASQGTPVSADTATLIAQARGLHEGLAELGWEELARALAAALEAAEAQIARLRKERDDAHTEWAAMQATATRHRERAEAAEARATDAEHGRELARLDADNERRLNRIGGDDEGGVWQPPGFWRERALAAEAQRDTLATALEEIESFPVSGYHAGAAQRIARAALAAVEPLEGQPC